MVLLQEVVHGPGSLHLVASQPPGVALIFVSKGCSSLYARSAPQPMEEGRGKGGCIAEVSTYLLSYALATITWPALSCKAGWETFSGWAVMGVARTHRVGK